MIKAVFFDRDGTLIEDPGYLSSREQVVLIPQAVVFARICYLMGYSLFIVTNQSGIARGMFDEAFVQATNDYVTLLLAEHGAIITKSYYCPHHKTAGSNPAYTRDCACRKPKPGMLTEAALEYGIDLQRSFMIGDTERDLQAGEAAGCVSLNIHDIIGLSIPAMESLLQSSDEQRMRMKKNRLPDNKERS